ncbi:glycoside hydrolase family 65 protein [Nocardioides campestrisoli]|uniref:glycoside hydrolase family 65 protein n=1 Tax=Nocardioides campestrisoli TaxID=2736757 RepID=UPI0015E7BF5B|nr:glycoside hydrolase family 65 protein [Nocardioides campestrisoli]
MSRGRRYRAHHPLDRHRFPADPWALVETEYTGEDLGRTETLFSVANGYLGMRGNPEEGREAIEQGTYINGFHETWPIRHAEAAFGFARTGQTIVNVPDAKVVKLYVDDEPLMLGTSELEHYERVLDFSTGTLRRELIWRTPSGKRVKVESSRMVSMTERHLAIVTFEVTMLEGNAAIVVSSQLLNRQDGTDEYYQKPVSDEQTDPRKAGHFVGRVLQPKHHCAHDDRIGLGYRCSHSGMTLAVEAQHHFTTTDDHDSQLRSTDDLAKQVFRIEATEGNTARLEKIITYHTSRGVPVRELADRCERTLDRAARHSVAVYQERQRHWYDEFWAESDVLVDASPEIQQAIRFNLFMLAQATGRADGQGIAAKGVTGSGYEGHYFWDTEIYVLPFLTYTQPALARNALHFRRRMLPAARARAAEMAQSGALFPWRTINGEEASAYYAAGSAQMHINADIVHAVMKYVAATDDTDFLRHDGVDLLVETARMWRDLGFWRGNGGATSFHIHGVTGPDEYTTVVNNNLFTNLMARANLESAARVLTRMEELEPDAYAVVASRLRIQPDEVVEWQRCADLMTVPFDEGLGIHPQDDFFLDREVWDLSQTPESLRPLMLHYHPLVIYRFQVLKQADVVLALFLHGDWFTEEEKKADFEYYDPITTGDSTLSAVVQSIVAAEVGYHEAAMDYFLQALNTDLGDLHDNTVDGIHVASAGGVWAALVNGFGGMRDYQRRLTFEPRLPSTWGSLTFRVTWLGNRIRVHLTQERITFEVVQGDGAVELEVRGQTYKVSPEHSLEVPLPDQGPRIDGLLGDKPQTGGVRSDGSKITAGVPDPIALPDQYDPYASPYVLPTSGSDPDADRL